MTDEAGAVFALFDDCDSTALARSSRLYSGFSHERVCVDPAGLDAVCAAVADDARRGLHAVVLGDYEFGRDLQFGKRGGGALRFLLFAGCEMLSRDEADAWLASRDGGAAQPSAAGVAHVTKSVARDAFDAAIAAVHDALRAGDSYQINYTYRLHFDAFGAPLALYRRLRARQPVRYGALVALPGGAWVVSCSPELFVEKSGALLRARPMKGTAPRSDDPREDAAAARFLANDAKNRAENVMIVDLLRNDLARIARTGSVTVPALFSVEPYASVWQMTSTVEAGIVDGATFADVLRALFPCGSITGAPKHRTMQLIDAIETTPRGLYTGAIGWLDACADGGAPAARAAGAFAPERASGAASGGARAGEAAPEQAPKRASTASPAGACGDFCLSVAIRTLTLDAPSADGARRGTMGVGAGIVLDSVAADEYAECELKARFLTDADPGFQLFETMHAARDAGVRHLGRHLARLRASADALGFAFDEAAAKRRIEARCAQLADGEHRCRVALAKDGALDITAAPLAPLAGDAVTVLLAHEHGFAPMRSGDFLLAHKTTRRADYDRAWKDAEARGAFDMLFFNERGELTEGGRTSVFVKLDGRWFTPPLSSGVLPGVMRGALLDDPAWQASERVMTLDDVLRADALMLTNALRGAVPARLVRAAEAAARR
ncbi:bifunctional anthranilate synthase component I family protein/class IV aminotransferase [Burkholderia thailandensis]|uniref:bifunctional anthranilate synthase component I family protein/class IV aminotransferase n=1 Tax=Burkholderia thailandensis TaxID=57975 RepID=UPI0022ABD616|nr:bifunctional anthranilate synthase component I family protein/class IV aminotransferase [Burkholderia thailandensis]MCZ2898325.1 bifunctional anthranilate synthase component I family protein/class IV aminotransferase [Burkholderia thailandensis]MDD1479008.1 chloride transporter [Burkholderia thailandensis]MDD1485955.1 chloride transporter [Burkholderia thailandensis]MDD1490879.1 chloride transporter [Burkholderia thailandensis]